MRKPYRYDKKTIEAENQHDHRRISVLQPVISFKEFEKDFRSHVKYQNNLARSHKILPPPMRLGEVLDVSAIPLSPGCKSQEDLQAEYLERSRVLSKLQRHFSGNPVETPSLKHLEDEDYDFPYNATDHSLLPQKQGSPIEELESASHQTDLVSTTGSVQWRPDAAQNFEAEAVSSVQHIPVINDAADGPAAARELSISNDFD